MPASTEEAIEKSPFRLAIGIATHKRPVDLQVCLEEITSQTRQPDRVIVCHVSPEDVAGVGSGMNFEAISSAPGLPRQRNVILRAATDCDAILFLDDDFLMGPEYVAETISAFKADPAIVVTTGDLIADGAKGPGFSATAARSLIAADSLQSTRKGVFEAPHGYGCNMAIRLQPVREQNIWFDERLPLYAWSEDMDFTHRLGRHGRIVKLQGARGVHLGTKSGRTSGHRLGYSQVANPIYLFGKGSYTFGRAARSVGRNIAANFVKSAWPEPYIDRRGRLRGNMLAAADVLRGRLAPERILEL